MTNEPILPIHTKIDRTFVYCDAEFARRCQALHQNLIRLYEAGEAQFRLEIFETYRSGERQDRLFAEGVSEARAGQSPHNFGLAADFVPYLSQAEAVALGVRPGWHWPKASDKLWIVLAKQAAKAGLVAPIRWDKPHVEFPNWKARARGA